MFLCVFVTQRIANRTQYRFCEVSTLNVCYRVIILKLPFKPKSLGFCQPINFPRVKFPKLLFVNSYRKAIYQPFLYYPFFYCWIVSDSSSFLGFLSFFGVSCSSVLPRERKKSESFISFAIAFVISSNLPPLAM